MKVIQRIRQLTFFDCVGWSLAIVTVGLVIFVVFGLCFMAGHLVWNVVDPPQGMVVGHGHSPAHVSTMYVKSGDVFVPIIQHHPESWSLTVDDEGWTRFVPVSEATWESYENGEQYP